MDSLIKMENLDHMAFVVKDVRRAAQIWSQLLNVEMPPIEITGNWNKPEDQSHKYRGEIWHYQIKIARFYMKDGTLIELVEPETNGTFREYYEKHGPGIHHIAFHVGNQYENVLKSLQKMGFDLRMEHPRWTIVDTEDVLGTNLNIKP